jgi:hypothetical protein
MKRALVALALLAGCEQTGTLDVKVTGNGLVRTNPKGIECHAGETCTASYAGNVTVIAQPLDDQTVFAGWLDDGNCPGRDLATFEWVVHGETIHCTATFTPAPTNTNPF